MSPARSPHGGSPRTLVVGNGMAAVRLVEQLLARGVDGLTVVGDEAHAPYNRILLSAVLEGGHRREALTMRPPSWYAEHGVSLRLASRVTALDLDAGHAVLADGDRLGFDRAVLATGSRPTLPPIRGLVGDDGELRPAVHAFRSLDDCDRLDAAAATARSAVVVGGGLLGLQVARALAVRGVAVEVVEGGDHLLRSQVDAPAGATLARSLTRLGTAVYTGVRAVALTRPDEPGAEVGLRLDNGHVLDTDLVVITAGCRPAVGLARDAGLATRRGVLVDRHLRTSDPRVSAIGDCAEPAGPFAATLPGYVAPAWEQAEVLAAHLAGERTAYTGTRSVVRLRATDLDVAVLGDPLRASGERVEVSNPLRGTHRTLVVRDGRVVAGTLVGDLSRVATISQLFDRGTVLGAREAGALLLPEPDPGAGGPAPSDLPDDAEVCACAGVSAARLRGCVSLEVAQETTRAATGCGSCRSVVEQLVGARAGASV